LVAARDAFDAFGPFLVLAAAVPLTRPRRTVLLDVPLVLTAGPAFNRELLSDPATWRGVSLLPGGPRNSAARRISQGLTRVTGERHVQYRRLLAPPLHKDSVRASAARMAQLAEAEVASWPTGETVDLWDQPRRVMQRLAIELLFGGGDEQGYHIADMVSRLMQGKWSPGAFVPINLPVTPYGRIVRESELLERRILHWAQSKRGRTDSHDLASIIVNSSDADGRPLPDAAIIGQIPSLVAAASEAAQSALTWTLLLVAQHPEVASNLVEELRSKLAGPPPAVAAAGELPYLAAVVDESMRILPPVPVQIRVAQRETTIADCPVPAGTRVMLSTFLTNRMPDLYPEGDVFRPERWFGMARSPFQYPVFSGGPHGCPGYWFGLQGVRIALAAILTRYRPEFAPDARIDYKVQPTMRPLHKVPMRLVPQDGAFAAAPISGTIAKVVRFPQ